MSLPKKTLLACVSAAALVASVGFVQAQSPDQDSTAMVNVNNGVDRGDDDRTYDADRLPANNYDPAPMTSSAADASVSADASMSQPANGVAAASTTAAPTDYNTLPATSAGNNTATTTAPASADSNLVVTSTPETRIDLSPPSDPLYNLPPEGERAPRPDRN